MLFHNLDIKHLVNNVSNNASHFHLWQSLLNTECISHDQTADVVSARQFRGSSRRDVVYCSPNASTASVNQLMTREELHFLIVQWKYFYIISQLWIIPPPRLWVQLAECFASCVRLLELIVSENRAWPLRHKAASFCAQKSLSPHTSHSRRWRGFFFLLLLQKSTVLADACSSSSILPSLSTLLFRFPPFLLLTYHPDSHDFCASFHSKSYLMCIQTSSIHGKNKYTLSLCFSYSDILCNIQCLSYICEAMGSTVFSFLPPSCTAGSVACFYHETVSSALPHSL